jgi:hypothetical protein
MTQASIHTSDQGILSAWQQGLSEASKDVTFKQALLQRECELLPRFEEHYKRLKTLPRRMRRALQRQWRRSLAGLALLLVLGQAPALAATINVGGQCTLVRAINSANTDTAVGGCTRGSGADTIVLPSGITQTLTAVNNNNPDYGPTGLPIIRNNITIAGNRSTIRRVGTAPQFRIFTVARTGYLRLQQTTVSGGVASGAFPGADGGGIESHGYYISGTGNFDPSSLTITNSTILGNRAGNWGGGVDNSGYDRATITNSTISGNVASEGGGLFNFGVSTLTHSTLSGNTASSRGGGLINLGGAEGIRIRLNRTLISGNTAPRGREIFAQAGRTYFYASNFNLFGHSGLTNAQAFENFRPGATDITATSNGNRPTALAGILNPTLANNGGPTRTHALVAGSPAIDTVTDGTCPPPNTDQRGLRRPQDGNNDGAAICDTGSFERQ